MTTLELCEAIATAVIRATQPAGAAPYGDAPTQAVIETLHKHDSWFCKMDPTVSADWPEEHEERYELLQPSLFK